MGLVLLAVGVFCSSYFLRLLYILANIVFPNSVERMADEAAKAGRSLQSNPAALALDNLHQDMLMAVDKYNQLQETYYWEH